MLAARRSSSSLFGARLAAMAAATGVGVVATKDSPAVQATGRAWNLFRTVSVIAMDYKTADWKIRRPRLDQDDDDNNNRNKNAALVEYWEKQVQEKTQALHDAQTAYATSSSVSSSHHHHAHATNTAITISHHKQQQKEQMLQAAMELAQTVQQQHDSVGAKNSPSSAIHYRSARRLLQLCHQNKGVYIKIGQHLANLDYLIPPEFIETLATLFDSNPPSPLADVYAVLQEELGAHTTKNSKNPSDLLFDQFDSTPIASASLAQVHTAHDKVTGRKLAIKVQHRGLAETAVGDLAALAGVVRAAEFVFGKDQFQWGWICEEIQQFLPLELDFQNEGRNAERAAKHLETLRLDCVIPKIRWEYTSRRVLVMEFEEGFNATDIGAMERAGLCKKDVAKLISSVFASQIFLSGWVHADPHPANMLIRAKANSRKPEMVLIDHGLYRELDHDFSRHYSRLWKALMLADVPAIREACACLGVNEAYPLFAGLLTARPFDEILARSRTSSLDHHRPQNAVNARADKMVMRGYAQRYLGEILQLLNKIPRQMLLLLKTADCLRHIDQALGSPINTLVVSGGYAALAVYLDEHSDVQSWLGRFRAWLRYMSVVVRIRIHQTVLLSRGL
jgi:aarF domain-containing kinase